MTYAEIARREGISESAAFAICQRALAKVVLQMGRDLTAIEKGKDIPWLSISSKRSQSSAQFSGSLASSHLRTPSPIPANCRKSTTKTNEPLLNRASLSGGAPAAHPAAVISAD